MITVAYRCFLATDMDVLVMGNCIIQKTEQPGIDRDRRREYIDSFQLD